jgi:hypothetical protein
MRTAGHVARVLQACQAARALLTQLQVMESVAADTPEMLAAMQMGVREYRSLMLQALAAAALVPASPATARLHAAVDVMRVQGHAFCDRWELGA